MRVPQNAKILKPYNTIPELSHIPERELFSFSALLLSIACFLRQEKCKSRKKFLKGWEIIKKASPHH